MKIFTLNGSKTALNIFAGLCLFTLVYFGFLHNSGAVAVSGEPAKTSYLAIVITGFGSGNDGTREFMYMDIPMTAAVMPASPGTVEEARQLLASGKEVIIHMPMEDRNMRNIQFPEINIMNSHTKGEARAALLKAIDQIPAATGIANYLGSRVMENEELLTTILSTTIEHSLYFIDTAANPSKASHMAENLGTKVFESNIVIDGSGDIGRIERNLRRAAAIAEEKGFAIAIGRVGPGGGRATAQAITNMKAELTSKGIVFVTLTELSNFMAE